MANYIADVTAGTGIFIRKVVTPLGGTATKPPPTTGQIWPRPKA